MLPKGLTVKRGLSGLGLFATKEFSRGDEIIEYTGEHITGEEADRRGGKYLFQINDSLTIDGRGRENHARYLNHSCKPNCYAEITADEKGVFIFAKRKIKPGEECTYYYGKDYFKRIIEPAGCRCEHCNH